MVTMMGTSFECGMPGFKFPDLWDPAFLGSLGAGASDRAAELVREEVAGERIRLSQASETEQ